MTASYLCGYTDFVASYLRFHWKMENWSYQYLRFYGDHVRTLTEGANSRNNTERKSTLY